MDPELLKRIQAWFDEKGVTFGRCEMCGNATWRTLDSILYPSVVAARDGKAGLVPFIVVGCEKCAFTRLFAAYDIVRPATPE